MDLRERQCKGVMKIGVIEMYSNGKEDAIKPFDMPTHEKESWTNHASNVIAIIKHYVPNAEIHLVPSSKQGIDYLIKNEIKLINMSLSSYAAPWHKELSNHSFICIAAGNDGAEGESGVARIQNACAVGAIKSDLSPQSYSSYGKGVVKTCAITGLDTYTGKMLHGTSFASPVITGLLAQWFIWFKESFGVYPSIRHTNRFIIENSHDVFDDAWDLRTGYGLFRLPKIFEHKSLELKDGEKVAIINKVTESIVVRSEIDLVLTPFIKEGRFVTSTRDIGDFAEMTVNWEQATKTGVFIE
jgi:hypothetical protein